METGFILSFLAGVASLISPCVLPLIPIVLGHSILKNSIKEVIYFILGFFLLFTVITILTVIFTSAINYYLYYFRIAAAILLIMIGFFFLLNLKIPNLNILKSDTERNSSFALGFITCLAWSPCFGPYVVAVATYSASTGNIFYSALNMILFAAGFSVTLLILAIIASRISNIGMKKYYKWIRIISGLVIAIAGFYMLIGFL
jgi:cytochrome c-type biogenesis protein